MNVSVELPYPLEEVFAFFSKPENLAKLTPPAMGFRILNREPIEMKSGREISYRIRPLGLPMKWVSLIQTWDPPHEFSDLQLKGPFRYWLHSHRYTATETGTRMDDHILYRVPGGALPERLFVRKQLIQQFAYRTARIQEFFPA
jgi:ligand-binding SRPBCC domain-containing protein